MSRQTMRDLIDLVLTEAETDDLDRSLMVAPQRWLDPTNKKFKPGLGDFVQGGRYLDVTDKANKIDVTGRHAARANITAMPKPMMRASKVDHAEPATRAHGSKQMVNLLRRVNDDFAAGSVLWNWVEKPADVPEDLRFLVSLNNSKGHFYAFEIDYPDGVSLARYPDERSEPRLKPTTYGEPVFGTVMARIRTQSGKEHPVYDKIVIKRRLSR